MDPRPCQARDAENLATMHLEACAAQPTAADVPDLEDDRGVGTGDYGRVVVRVDVLADDQAREAMVVDLRDGRRRDDASSA